MESLKQLLQYEWTDDDGEDIFVVSHTPVLISDASVYGYRGLLMDTSRHYLSLRLIRRNLDAMTANKLNVLHWHMVDDQSWPLRK